MSAAVRHGDVRLKPSLFSSLFVITISLLLSACSADPDYSRVLPLSTISAPVAPVASKLEEYKVQIGDVLDLEFYLNPEFNETVTVRPDGMISTKVAKSISVYNKTITDINNDLKQAYTQDLKDPHVNVVVRSFAPIRIYVSGEVNFPGEYVVVGQALTLTQAIARAGGIKNSGLQNKVLIIRRGAGERGQVLIANYYAATQGADYTQDARLAADDVVFVPRTGVAEDYVGFQQRIQQFINPASSIGAAYTIK